MDEKEKAIIRHQNRKKMPIPEGHPLRNYYQDTARFSEEHLKRLTEEFVEDPLFRHAHKDDPFFKDHPAFQASKPEPMKIVEPEKVVAPKDPPKTPPPTKPVTVSQTTPIPVEVKKIHKPPTFTSKFPQNKEKLLNTSKVLDKNAVREVMNATKERGTTGSYTNYMTRSHRGEAQTLNEERIIKKAQKIDRAGRYGALVAGGLIGVATVLDIGTNIGEAKDVKRMVAEQEKDLARRQGQEAKEMRKKSHDYVDMGEIVQEMFNERIGHHKMGNSKFQ